MSDDIIKFNGDPRDIKFEDISIKDENDAASTGDEYEQQEFWSRRPFLQFTYQLAKSKLNNPWAMLMINTTRMLTAIDPGVVLPETVRSSHGSLNLYTVIYGPSGAGKSTAFDISRQYFCVSGEAKKYPLATGEGMTSIFVNSSNKQQRRAAMVWIDEGGALKTSTSRQGSTFWPVLREMWVGTDTGQYGASKDRQRTLDAHNYRLCFVIGIQERLCDMFTKQEQIDLGTPQRFIWARIQDPTITYDTLADIPEPPEKFYYTPPEWARMAEVDQEELGFHVVDRDNITTMAYEPGVAELIRQMQLAHIVNTEPNELDSHYILMLSKLAGALALIEGRRTINMEDLELARVWLRRSDANRDALIKQSAVLRKKRDEDFTRRQAYMDHAKDQVTEDIARDEAVRLSNVWAQRFAGMELSNTELVQRLSSAERKLKDDVLVIMLAAGEVTVRRERLHGSQKPSRIWTFKEIQGAGGGEIMGVE